MRRLELIRATAWLAFFVALVACMASLANAAPPEILRVTYPIVGNRSALGSATAIGPNLTLSADHVIRDDVSSLGPVIAVDRKYDRCLIRGENETWSELRRTPVQPGETLYFAGGTLRVQPDLSFEIVSGKVVQGMSGGPIWSSDGKIVSVVCEGDASGTGRLWGYLGLDEWVDSVTGETVPPRPAPVVAAMPAECECVDCQCDPCECGVHAPRPDPVATELNTLTFYTQPGCPPCEAFKRACLPTLKAKGWHVVTVQTTTLATPTFEYQGRRFSGFTSAEAFYGRLREVIE